MTQQPTASQIMNALARIEAEDLAVYRLFDWTVRTKEGVFVGTLRLVASVEGIGG